MTSSYSIEKIGNEYVVKVDNQRVMTVGTRRKAARLVAQASGMLEQAILAVPAIERRDAESPMRSCERPVKPA